MILLFPATPGVKSIQTSRCRCAYLRSPLGLDPPQAGCDPRGCYIPVYSICSLGLVRVWSSRIMVSKMKQQSGGRSQKSRLTPSIASSQDLQLGGRSPRASGLQTIPLDCELLDIRDREVEYSIHDQAPSNSLGGAAKSPSQVYWGCSERQWQLRAVRLVESYRSRYVDRAPKVTSLKKHPGPEPRDAADGDAGGTLRDRERKGFYDLVEAK
ncbi:uncharacterized protein EI90DRAFT_3291364 [Cantharellus anzutake]|uniref:uncharacterized protein n=1 Tax=Cantharellus anzutake TaxID=1750568 RepID=UPI001903E935|nr:uncharacterized protein EI90DRAFT_3291364 [Cantharellus anzutake]KAF8326680.1 hypothetical protein EI90DRAFT_3291364 [Cantharellus anzutake]